MALRVKFISVVSAMILLLAITFSLQADTIIYDDNWHDPGFNLMTASPAGLDVTFSIDQFILQEVMIDGRSMMNAMIPGIMLPNDEGAPNLPGTGRYIAIPEGATASFEIVNYRTEVFTGIELAPAPKIPFDNDNSPLVFSKNSDIYEKDAYYPEKPVIMSKKMEIRGVDVVILGITPFQYNPVTKELLVYRDLEVRIDFQGGSGYFGEDRLRSRYWEPLLQEHLLNYSSLPQVNLNRIRQTDEDNVEYIIIVPDDPVFLAWADSIKAWRNQQGVITGITTLTEIGGNNTTLIENYINNAYHNWEIPPAAILLLSDYQSSGDVYGITSPMWNNYCVSDNIYADVDNDDLPDIHLARITAQNYGHLATMIGKMFDYERNPPTDPGFYQHPITAGGWQTERWFILCTEICWGFMHNELGKDPVREYAIYMGTPGTQWSSNGNTYMLVDYFGPNGLGYIPNNPSYLNDWGANAARVNNDINEGAFLLLHRDHGGETGWGEPSYNISSLSGLQNEMLPFVFSINCLTGKYNWGSQCFTEAFHRMEHGALGLIAASEISYSFVNDTYIFGIWDSMWPDFDPGYGTDLVGSGILRPAFANSSGKHYLNASSWPYNPNNKTHTNNLFHHHGDAFITLYSEVPQDLMVLHNNVLLGGMDEFTVTANAGAIIALTVNNEIIGVAEATGGPVVMTIPPQNPGSTMLVTVTLPNYYRYMQEVAVIPPSGPFVIVSGCVIEDESGWNPNGLLDYGEWSALTLPMDNIGVALATNVTVSISTEDPLLAIIDNIHYYGNIQPGATVSVPMGFELICAETVENGHMFTVDVEATSDTSLWESSFALQAMAPEVIFERVTVSDPLGNNNNWLDPGETADLEVFVLNDGASIVNNLEGLITSADPYLTINGGEAVFGDVPVGETMSAVFNVTASASTPMEHVCSIDLEVSGDRSYTAELEFGVMVGNILNAPTGPDNYGYMAYDPFDLPEMPVYEWIEICPSQGGQGVQVPFTIDDQVFQYATPFTFQYYGIEYDTVSIGANGWVGMGRQTEDDYSNSGIPNSDGPFAMIAAYWEDLSPQRPNSGGVWEYYDDVNHLYIVEYNHIEQYAPVGNFETFQAILYDPEYYTTASGDGRIKVQYKEMSVASQSEGTIGIENHTETDGLQYFFDTDYDIHAHQIENETCILYSTTTEAPDIAVTLTPYGTPIVLPAAGGTFEYNIDIENIGISIAVFDVWIEVVLPSGTVYGPLILRNNVNLNPGVAIVRDMTQNIPGGAPEGDYIYRCNTGVYPAAVMASDEFGFEKSGVDASSGGEWLLDGWDSQSADLSSLPAQYELRQNQPNPFNPETSIEFGLPQSSQVEILVFNLLGRQVAELQNGYLEAGYHTVTFDASAMSSGVYFYMMKTADHSQVKKMLLVK